MVMVGASWLVTKGRVSISVAQASLVVSLPLEVYQSQQHLGGHVGVGLEGVGGLEEA